jgi:hypothetical protein
VRTVHIARFGRPGFLAVVDLPNVVPTTIRPAAPR